MEDPQIRAHLEKLAELGFAVVRDDGRGVDAVFSRGLNKQIQGQLYLGTSDSVAAAERASFDAIAPAAIVELRALADKTTEIPEHYLVASVPERRAFWLTIVLPVLLIGCTIASIWYWFAGGYQAVGVPPISFISILPAIPCVGGWVWLCSRWLRGRRVFANQMIVAGMLTFFATLFAWFTVPLSLNVLLDASPVQTHVGRITDVSFNDGLDTGFELYFTPGANGAESTKLFISHDRATKLTIPLTEAQFVRLQYRSGAFGDAYFISYDTIDSPPDTEDGNEAALGQ